MNSLSSLSSAAFGRAPTIERTTCPVATRRHRSLNVLRSPCGVNRKEMPALERLEAKLGGDQFQVVAVNIDTRDPDKPKNFLKEANLTRLGNFSDAKAKVFQDLKAIGLALGMPTSVLIDGNGCQIGNIAGPAEWDSDDAIKLIQAALKP